MSQNFKAGAIIAISSHVMRGSVGNRAITFSLSALGYPVWSVPTVVLPWHPGQGPSTRLTFDEAAFQSAMTDLEQSPWRNEVKAVVTGYFASAGQVRAAAGLISALRREKPELLYLCDPVIGDRGGLYVPEVIAEAIRDFLLPLASFATPNRFELGWLSNRPVENNQQIVEAARLLGVPRAVITSAYATSSGAIANLYVDGSQLLLAEHRELSHVPNGLGDLFSALFLARSFSGQSGEDALRLSTAAVFQAAAHAVDAGANELLLEDMQNALRVPYANVQLRQLPSLNSRLKQD
ncbi:pyridoxal kinase [Rhizobium sp. L1K21]|uniref:pyridoxal kinase n=1 Tax=Rhizobium sp. L1K21 TaxID=2954933 RepID=UPI002092CDF5|nr:pyridoxal kinase [Rhizobium sp. L1K21]MCO6188029.1 pyridoxal kinase [Rhizobium sp. L1K21]